jgi:4-amino-4-deoxy-L-arabinose transferase-like glycosyltransferase
LSGDDEALTDGSDPVEGDQAPMTDPATGDTVPTDTVPTDTVPTDTLPDQTVPNDTDDAEEPPPRDHLAKRAGRRGARLLLGTPKGVHPLLVVFAGLAGLAYAWGSSKEGLEPYYAAAVRSMSTSWHNFYFGSFDPAGTITVDKLPGALWLQALSVRWFGLHVWAIVLPQVVEGVLAVFVIYRAVARLASPVAGVVAAGILAVAPATVALDRGNVSDSLLTLLLVLAASATTKAIVTGHWRSLLLAGLWVGLAFQAKMVQAWVVLPALGLAYLIAGAPRLRRRVAQLGVAGVLCAAVSLSWMVAITLVPQHHRPYVDGSAHDSIFEQVFEYNGLGRFTHSALLGSAGTPTALAARVLGSFLIDFTLHTPATWHRLLSGPAGRDTAWLIPLALLSSLAVFVARRREPRTDPLRAAAILWTTWLVAHLVLFSTASSINAYYMGVLSPALAALCAGGFELGRAARGLRLFRPLTMLVGLAFSTLYALWLLHGGHGVPGWVRPTIIGTAAFAGAVVIVSALARRLSAWLVPLGAVALAACVLVAPSAASAALVSHEGGPFDTPFESQSTGAVLQIGQHPVANSSNPLGIFDRFAGGAHYVLATYTSLLAASFIFTTGAEVLPIGGFTGAVPSPSLARLEHLVDTNQLRFVLATTLKDPRLVWIAAHCRDVTPHPPAAPAAAAATAPVAAPLTPAEKASAEQAERFAVYFCTPPTPRPGATGAGS